MNNTSKKSKSEKLFTKIVDEMFKLEKYDDLDGTVIRKSVEAVFEKTQERSEKKIREIQELNEDVLIKVLKIVNGVKKNNKLFLNNIKNKNKVIIDTKNIINKQIDQVALENYINNLIEILKEIKLDQKIIEAFIEDINNNLLIKNKNYNNLYIILSILEEDETISKKYIEIKNSELKEDYSLVSKSEILSGIILKFEYLIEKNEIQKDLDKIQNIIVASKQDMDRFDKKIEKTNETILDNKLIEVLEKNDINNYLLENIDGYTDLPNDFVDKLINILYLFKAKNENILNSFIKAEEKQTFFKITFSRKGSLKQSKINSMFSELKPEIKKILQKNIVCDFKD